jgi:hypothetical protein
MSKIYKFKKELQNQSSFKIAAFYTEGQKGTY